MKPYYAVIGSEVVVVIGHEWSGKAMLAVFVRRDRRVSDITTLAVAFLSFIGEDDMQTWFVEPANDVAARAYAPVPA